MNTNASTFVEGVDVAFYVILGISMFFLVGITAFMVWVVIKYNKKRNPTPTDVKDNMKLEVAWTVIPTILVLFMFYYGWIGYKPMRDVPDGAIEIKATGRMWSWDFEYENGKRNDTLFVPVGKPVKLNLYSPDVIHSLYIPAFRVKEDVTPGIDNYMWFQSDLMGSYDLFCAEYCGLNHSKMITQVVVVSENEYAKWLESTELASDKTTPLGLQVLQKNGCLACHSSDGSKIVGPTFKGLYGTERPVEIDGEEKKVMGNDDYIARAIYEPNKEVAVGYNMGLMISYKDRINDTDLKEMIDYLKTLK